MNDNQIFDLWVQRNFNRSSTKIEAKNIPEEEKETKLKFDRSKLSESLLRQFSQMSVMTDCSSVIDEDVTIINYKGFIGDCSYMDTVEPQEVNSRKSSTRSLGFFESMRRISVENELNGLKEQGSSKSMFSTWSQEDAETEYTPRRRRFSIAPNMGLFRDKKEIEEEVILTKREDLLVGWPP